MVFKTLMNFSTRDLPASEQFDAWRCVNAPVIELELLGPRGKGFEADLTVWNLGGLILTRAIMPGPDFARRWRHLRKEPLDHWCLVIAQSASPGASDSGQAERYLGFRSLARPFSGFASDTHVLTLFIPRDFFGGDASAFDAIEGDIPDTGVGAFIADYLLMLEKRLPRVGVDEWPSIVAATRSLIVACLSPTCDHFAEAQPILNRTAIMKAKEAIQKRIGQPHYGPAQLCREIGVSRSKLYRLFEPLGGVAHYIQRQRLLRIHAELSDANNLDSINRVADKFGFVDASGFSRAFRKEFGYSPTEARAAALSSTLLIPAPPRLYRAPHARDSPLGEILRGLHG